ncbi:ParB/RepB/Spo0J family partition protein [Thauera aminoaromatica]|uniref:ParB/RepB/Spo0J family partition protein n=1 Tax=Thauera aminoaromatica TaxID=164330 RepID=A0A5C7SLQ2_THASP|nr:ParB/RepB/Spo0J family partition protein [Thauera aminoaromatica]TXH84704.1 MAG: ParB/RepB/Spo0J family partition protein [Thauera aminoaromatica]
MTVTAAKTMGRKATAKTGASTRREGHIAAEPDTLNPPDTIARVARPLELPLELIDEDPEQPRTADNPGFSAKSIAEIGQTIKSRGVKSPISVREHPHIQGRYLINHGARRFRASKWAEKTTIPAFIDNDYNHADQVIENLQRNELTPREIADFIGRELAAGKKKSEIAREIGKSPAFVTQHVTLLDLPDPIAQAFNSGRASDVTVVSELVTAFRKNPKEVSAWLADDSQELTRGSVKLLREFLEDKRRQDAEYAHDWETGESLTVGAITEAEQGEYTLRGPSIENEVGSRRLRNTVVQVEHEGRRARLILYRRPTRNGRAWLKYEDSDGEFEADLTQVQLVALFEG